jgi:ribosomal protein S21
MYIVKLPKGSGADKFALDKALKKLKDKVKKDGLMEELKRRRNFLTKAKKQKRNSRFKFFID